ncbi:MAG: sodium:proton antiporter NhaD [Bacteroidales bacterium]|nr:sodium:proton antiporter NhaD [Bacteroidales bacterium]MCB9013546.1 sodium:proton antiporter NhaD [Bacteroidales bacterium]
MLTLSLILLFLAGYTGIALEHPLKINKTAIALLLAVGCWILYSLGGQPVEETLGGLSEHLSDVAQILFFLLGAMTIVEMIDSHKGFSVIVKWVHTKNKVSLLWMVGFITFFLSSILDNLTTSIVMVSLLRKIVSDKHDRMILASSVIIAANAGGAWTPIGDVTTTMLWIGGRITSWSIMKQLFIPSMVCLIVPLGVQSFFVKGKLADSALDQKSKTSSEPGGIIVLILGVASLIFVPIFKTLTHLPPFMGILLGVGLMWAFTDLYHKGKDERKHLRLGSALSRVDLSSVLFFLGILLAVGALQERGILTSLAQGMDKTFSDKRIIIYIIGLLSAVVDNVPLVASGMGMWNLTDFPADNALWEMLAYCAGTGGSILIIGSAAGVVVMGMEKIEFFWYVKRVSLYALLGYTAGFLVYISMNTI